MTLAYEIKLCGPRARYPDADTALYRRRVLAVGPVCQALEREFGKPAISIRAPRSGTRSPGSRHWAPIPGQGRLLSSA